MFPYFLFFGFIVLLGFVLIVRWYVNAETGSILRVLKWLALIILGGLLLFFVISGKFGWTVMALPALIPVFIRLRTALNTFKNFSRMAGFRPKPNTNNTIEIKTDSLKMALNQETGHMKGEILNGPYKGCKIEKMEQKQIFQVLDYCTKNDIESVQILEAYLDRVDPEWRNSFNEKQSDPGNQFNYMDKKEALEVLGLEDGASDKQIKDAYNSLISQLHPDRGGSHYLAAKINQAKEILLGN